MAGSKSEVSLVLLYNADTDKATWAIKSAALIVEEAEYYTYRIIWENSPDYAVYEKLAGPKPVVLVEEVTQAKPKEDNEITDDDGYTVYSDNIKKV